jgi:Zn-finger protein
MEVEIYEVKPDPGGEVCDFCFGPVMWRYPCESFVGPTAENDKRQWVQESVGAWAACNDCHALIENNQLMELAERSYNSANAPEGWDQIKRLIPKRELIRQFRVLHDQFLSHRLGPAVPVRTAA